MKALTESNNSRPTFIQQIIMHLFAEEYYIVFQTVICNLYQSIVSHSVHHDTGEQYIKQLKVFMTNCL